MQEYVFPVLRTYCEQRGAHFQGIYLRWGISEDAAREYKTVRICLEEIRRSQRLSPRPNFIVLLGNRYGWRPLPDEIPTAKYETLIQYLPATDVKLVNQWYRRDDNAVPPVYYLYSRDTVQEVPEYARLASILRNAALEAHLPSPVRRRERKMQRFKSPAFARRFLNIHSTVDNTFYVQRHLHNRTRFKSLRTEAFGVWASASVAV